MNIAFYFLGWGILILALIFIKNTKRVISDFTLVLIFLHFILIDFNIGKWYMVAIGIIIFLIFFRVYWDDEIGIVWRKVKYGT